MHTVALHRIMARFLLVGCLLLVGILLLLAAVGPTAYAEPSDSPPAQSQSVVPMPTVSPLVSQKVLVDAHDQDTTALLTSQGSVVLADYGSFRLWRVPVSPNLESSSAILSSLTAVSVRDDFDVIYFRDFSINPTHQDMPAVASALQQTRIADEQFWLVQFVGPVKDAWIAEIEQIGLQRVSYMPNNAYVVWGDSDALTRLDSLVASTSYVQWAGPYHPLYRLEPSLHQSNSSPQTANSEHMVDVTVQVYASEQHDATIQRLTALGGTMYREPSSVLKFINVSLQLPADQLATIAAWPDVFNVEPWVQPEKFDEVQNVIIAGNIVSTTEGVVPRTPGYLAWLDAKGFPSDPARYPVVDVVDDGIDIGDETKVKHPDFYELGDTKKPDRLVYIGNCTTDYNGNGVGGHGNINVGIVGSYTNLTGTFHTDSRGYRIGLGVSPYGRLAGTKVFENYGGYDLSVCGNSMSGLIEHVYTSGGDITSNSWGSRRSYYSADSQAYDALTRDASKQTAGNQEMLHIFSAGNSGPDSETVGTPGNAKNVLTVGATENVRDDGIFDGCYVDDADSADDIASFSSRGPTPDGRMKPDIVAPGTHIQGPASQDPGFRGRDVCGSTSGAYYPLGQTLYTWSTGTSHSAPAVAGAASLVYEYYGRMLNPGRVPSPAMLKALLLNSTRYLTGIGTGDSLPDTAQGWGGADIGMLFDGTPRSLVDQQIIFHDSGEEYQLSSAVHDTSKPLRVTLAWTDAPGSTTGGVAANDLDLEVRVGSRVYRGNEFAGAFSLPNGNFDTRNNVESIFLPASVGLSFTVRIIARTIAEDGVPGDSDTTDQDFALVISNDANGSRPPGILKGTMRDTETSQPIGRARIQATASPTQTYKVASRSDGSFEIYLPEGTYTIEASGYGYEPARVFGVVLREEEHTTRDIALVALPRVTVQGRVMDANATTRPLYASVSIAIDGYDYTAFTDPSTGVYSVSLVPDIPHTFTLRTVPTEWNNSSYRPQTRDVIPDARGSRVDFALSINQQSCNAIGYRKQYTEPFIYQQDFEQDKGGFSTYWAKPWRWGTVSDTIQIAHSGDKAWSIPLEGYVRSSSNMLTSASIDVSPYRQHMFFLSWLQKLHSNSHISRYDYSLYVDVSSDGGKTWKEYDGDSLCNEGEMWAQCGILINTEDKVISELQIRYRIYYDSTTPAIFAIDDVGVQAIEKRVIFQEDFEQDNGGFVVQSLEGLSSWEWGVPLTGPGYAHSGRNVWATNLAGDHYNGEESAIMSPAIDVSGYRSDNLLLSWWSAIDTYYTDGYVEISTDGGNSWKRIHHETNESNDWTRQSVRLDSSVTVSDFRFRFRMIGWRSYPGYYIDDIRIEAMSNPCKVEPGGLVVGHVYDDNTHKGVQAVVGDSVQYTTKSLIPSKDSDTADGIANDRHADGLYILFVPVGEHRITATGNDGYASATITARVEDGDVMTHDFSLAAARLVPQPATVQATLAMSTSTTVPLTIANTGQMSAAFTIEPIEYGYVPLTLEPVVLQSVGDTLSDEQAPGWTSHAKPDGPSSRTFDMFQPSRDAYIQTRGIDVLVLASAQVSIIQKMLEAYPDIKRVAYIDARTTTPPLHQLFWYDVVLVIADQPFADPVAIGDVLADYVDGGGRVVQSVPTFYAPSEGNWDIQGRFARERYSPFVGFESTTTEVTLGTYDDAHPIMRGVTSLWDNLRQQVVLTSGSHLIASWVDREPLVAFRQNVVAINMFFGNGFHWDQDGDVLVHNALVWLATRDQDPWFSVSPASGSLTMSSTLALSISLDAWASQVTQPGDYVAMVRMKDTTPYDAVTIPITMHVSAPFAWGKLAGTVRSLGYCNTKPRPLHDAEVLVEDSRGITMSLTTDISGTYQVWMDMASSPLTLTVRADGHEMVQTTGITLSTTQPTTRTFDVLWLKPCVQFSIDTLRQDIEPGERQTVAFNLTNAGASEATIHVGEANLGFVPLRREEPYSTTTTWLNNQQFIPSRLPFDMAQFEDVQPLLGEILPEKPNTGIGTPIPTGSRYRSAGASCTGHMLYVFGGWGIDGKILDESWRYDPAGDTWTALAPMPQPMTNMDAACIGSMIYLVGGYIQKDDEYGHTNNFFIYDTLENVWITRTWPDVASPAIAVWNGKLYTFGGFPGPSRQTFMYDPIEETWHGPLADMPKPAGYGDAATVGDSIYYIGGASEDVERSVYRYDPAANTWDSRSVGLKYPRMSSFAVWYGDYLYVVGGGDISYYYGWEVSQKAEVYDPTQWPEGSWTYTETLPLPVMGMAGGCIDSRIWTAGGSYGSSETSATQYMERPNATCHYDEETDTTWIGTSFQQSVIPAGTSVSMTLALDASMPSIEPGMYRAFLSVTSNDPMKPWMQVPVTMSVGQHVYLPLITR